MLTELTCLRVPCAVKAAVWLRLANAVAILRTSWLVRLRGGVWKGAEQERPPTLFKRTWRPQSRAPGVREGE